MQATDKIYLDDGMRGWIFNTARKEYWRVAELEDFDDLVQDGYLCFYKCKRRYVDPRSDLKHERGDVKWFQALVKTTFTNHIHSLAAKHKGVSVRPVSQVPSGSGEEISLDSYLPSQPEQASFLTLLASAPAEIKQLVKLLAGDSLNAFRFEWRRKGGRRRSRETNNELYCRILNLDPAKHDVASQVRVYFG